MTTRPTTRGISLLKNPRIATASTYDNDNTNDNKTSDAGDTELDLKA